MNAPSPIWGRLENVPSVPSFVPSLFPLSSSGILEFPVFWICWYKLYGRNALIVAIYPTTRNTGNIGNRFETA
jgi:hypothetical protein